MTTLVDSYQVFIQGDAAAKAGLRAEIRLHAKGRKLGSLLFFESGVPLPADTPEAMHLHHWAMSDVLNTMRTAPNVHFYSNDGVNYFGTDPIPHG